MQNEEEFVFGKENIKQIQLSIFMNICFKCVPKTNELYMTNN